MIIKFKRKQYNPSTEQDDGAVVFDTITKGIYLDKEEFGHFSTMDATGIIGPESTAQQFPVALAVYNYIETYIEQSNNYAIAYANELISKGIITPISNIPSMVYCPKVILNTDSTTATLNPVKQNAVHIYRQPLISLSINSIIPSMLETTIYFTTHETETFSYNFPQGMCTANVIKFDKGCNYCMSIKDNIVVLEKVSSYLPGSTFIFSSQQLTDGVLRSSPEIVEVAGTTPVINVTQPYTIYKFGEVTSITLNEIPANTLETVVYFEAGNTAVTLNLYAAIANTLKLSSGSVTNLVNGKFCMAIKDGIIVIAELKEIQ